MRSSPRALVAGAVVTALTTGLLTGTAAPAAADARSFQLDQYLYGANSNVYIAFGSLSRDCDFIETASDVYVVPTGSVGPGSSLSDVSGQPNTIQSWSLGSAIIDELVAVTAPGGTTPAGTYDLVEDTCQNGVFDGSDTILTNAFRVEIPNGVPPLPNGAIQQMKAGATAQAEHWNDAALSYAVLFTAYSTYELVSAAMVKDMKSFMQFYLTYICSTPLLPSDPNGGPVTPWCPTVSIQDSLRLQLEVVRSIVNKANHYEGIAADPPDPAYTEPMAAGPVASFGSGSAAPVQAALDDWSDTVGQGEALTGAFLGSLEKYQGAAEAGDVAAALMHARDVQARSLELNAVLHDQSIAVNEVAGALNAAGVDLDTAAADLRAFQARVAADGLTAAEEQALRNAGLSTEAIEVLTQTFTDEVSLEHPAASFYDVFSDQVDVNNQMASAFVGIANAMNPVVADLETALAVSGATPYPVVDAAGPYPAAVGAAATVTSSCTGCVQTTWDLDADGVFDDATGASTPVTFDVAGHRTVGVRVTDAAGRAGVDYATVVVTAPGSGPDLTADPVTTEPAEVVAGATRTFTATASDADGDPVTVSWTLDGAPAGTGPTYTFTASAAGGLVHELRATATDGTTSRSAVWLVSVVTPDADGDGWRTVADCDDTASTVHPHATEVPGNGADDDCDPATRDSGPPDASFTSDPDPGIVGEPVTLTDTSTDPDGSVTARAWDLDGDGSADATSASVTFTWQAAGTYPVTLTVTDDDGEHSVLTEDVTVTDRPVAAFTHDPAAPEIGNAVTFTDASTDADGVTAWEWDFAYDGSFTVDSTEQHPQRVFGADAVVALRVTDALGAVSAVTTATLDVSGPPVAAFVPRPAGGGTDVALVNHGSTVLSSTSQNSATYPAREMVDVDYPAGSTPWLTGNGMVTAQSATLGLADTYLVTEVRLRGYGSTQKPKDFSIGVSTAGSADGDFTTVLSAELANNANLQSFPLAQPVPAKFARYTAHNNRGSASYIGTEELKLITGQVGGATVTFQDRSQDPDADLVSYAWDFGDGGTSTEASPTHTYAGPGTYPVTLTVTDAVGRTATTTLTQKVVGPVSPAFAAPATLGEGSNGTFSDTTSTPDRAIVSRTINWGDGTSSTSGATAQSHAYPDQGTYEVRLTLVDSLGQTATATRQVTVTNGAPTVSAGPDAQLLVDGTWSPGVTVNDPGTADRASLVCQWDFGDGTVVDVTACTSSRARVPHTYTVDGTYTARITVTDKDGASAGDTATVTVRKSRTYLSVYAIPGTAGGGDVDVQAKVWDREAWALLPGVPVTLDLDGHAVTLTTDALGTVSATLPLAAATGTLTATHAGDRLRAAATDTDQVTTLLRPPGDVMFLVDESGSMGSYQTAVRNNINSMSAQLAASIDHQIGLIGFGAGSNHDLPGDPGWMPHLHMPVTDNLADVSAAASELTLTGGTEPGLNAIVEALADNTGLRPGAGTCVVLVADEPVQSANGVTQAHVAAALAARGAVLYSIITPGSASQGYQDLATGSGGQWFDIRTFGANPGPVLQALLEGCVAQITQRPDLVTTVDDGVTEVGAGTETTYTVTTDNSGEADATGVVVTADLPAGATFVSASDGGVLDGARVTWPTSDLVAGGSLTRTVRVRVDAGHGSELTVTATSADDGTHGADLTPANNTDSDTDTVVAPPRLVVVTEVVNDAGGSASADDVAVRVSDAGGVVAGGSGTTTGTTFVLTPGTYGVGSTGPAGYTATVGGACAPSGEVTLTWGDQVTCLITYDDVAPTLTVQVTVDNAEGGTATAADVLLTLDGAAVPAGEAVTTTAGSHAVAATAPVDYVLTIGGDCATSGAVALTLAQVAGCTVVATYVDPDTDGDGVDDGEDNCPAVGNPGQGDHDGDGDGDACEEWSYPVGGLFTVGAAAPHGVGDTVYYWGSQWAQWAGYNRATVNGFKGYVSTSPTAAAPTCGETWTSGPGNSTEPPAEVPEYMAVVVTSPLAHDSNTYSGVVEKIVIVRTDGAYGDSPGHPGRGEVVATICG
ncbi:PKD domain-containing protein [Antribacter gilvus]|uniref:PKD domain-containing protein n=1 Tax=Antribacter gilvus TaxID=2304675 RepID=UPI000F77B09F|nr:PKD domain-containing protein [Antribacter gilvus]